MRIAWLIVAAAVCVAACTEAVDAPVASTGEDPADTAPTTSAADSMAVPPQLADHDLDLVVVGDRVMLLAIADSPALRAQGLMGVTDLGDLDGMLFYWRHAASGGFWMKDTLVALDIVWFLADGSFADRASMVPCPPEAGDDCPLYAPAGDPDYRFAIEAPPGTLDWIDSETVIEYAG